eukprot:800329-Rhodomonas_salina.1
MEVAPYASAVPTAYATRVPHTLAQYRTPRSQPTHGTALAYAATDVLGHVRYAIALLMIRYPSIDDTVPALYSLQYWARVFCYGTDVQYGVYHMLLCDV